VRTGRAPFVTGRDGRDAVAIVTAAYESSRTGRAVVLEEVAV
jgi:predicted dehydrogenase